MNTHVKREIIAHAASLPTEEVCGLIYQDESGVYAYPCANVSPESRADTFEISSDDYIAARGRGTVCGIYHSNPTTAFSEADLSMAQEMCLPLYSYVTPTQQWSSYIPESYHVDPIGRTWAWGEADCLSTVTLHYRQTKHVYMTDRDRDESYQHINDSGLKDYLLGEGFVEVSRSEPILTDDVLLFRTPKSVYPHHVAVLVGPNRMLHHPRNQLSRVDDLDGAWLRHLVGVMRYAGKVVS